MSQSFRLFIVFCLALSLVGYAQDKDNLSDEVNVDDLGNNEDKFQEVFFKAIAQRAIENPEKAIQQLERCLELEPKSTSVFYELAKNYIDLKDYQKAEEYLKKTIKDPKYQDDVNIHKQLFYVYNMQKRYDDAIQKAEFIAESDPLYFQEVANLYSIQNDYKKALDAIDQYNAVAGVDDFRDNFRMIIYKEASMLEEGIDYYSKRFQNSKEDTKAGTQLMELYRLNNSPSKSIEVGKSLEQDAVTDPELYVEMAMAYLVSKNSADAKTYSKKVVESLTLEEKDKLKVINTFKAFALNNPEAQEDFISVLDTALSSEKSSSSKAELGEFYKSRDKDKALDNFKSALRNKPNDFELIKNILELELDLGKYNDLLETSSKALESFPSQGFLYYAKGVALQKTNKHKEATLVLEEALDYIFEEALEQKVFAALKASYSALGNAEKVDFYNQKLIETTN